jgi:long-subunit fatty acid transport protein
MYEDITYDLTWRHKFDPRWSARAGFRIYAGDWQGPVNRDDWIFTPSTGLTWVPHPKVNADLAYSYDWVESQVPNTEAREFTRHLVALSLKYTF